MSHHWCHHHHHTTAAAAAATATTPHRLRSSARSDLLWEHHCRRRWATKVPGYRLTSGRRASLEASAASHCQGEPAWLAHFRDAEEDGLRDGITRSELELCVFDFIFRWDTSEVASSTFQFCSDGMTHGHPSGQRFPLVLDADGKGLQWGPSGQMFPKARVVRRLDWGWRVVSWLLGKSASRQRRSTSITPTQHPSPTTSIPQRGHP